MPALLEAKPGVSEIAMSPSGSIRLEIGDVGEEALGKLGLATLRFE